MSLQSKIQDLKTDYKIYESSVKSVEEAIKRWDNRGFFGRAGAMLTSRDREATGVISEWKEARAEARKAVSLGGSILRDVKQLRDEDPIKAEPEAKDALSKIERDIAKSMPEMEKLASISDIGLWWKQSPVLAVLSLVAFPVFAALLGIATGAPPPRSGGAG